MTSYINSRIRRNRFSITRQKALLALFSILALCCFSSAAELKVQFRGVSENTVIEGETVTIELSLATADKLSNYPDFSVLNDDFYLGTQQTGFSSTYINGKFTARQSISLNLTPKRTGQIQIPSFTWSGFTSEPFKLTVVPLDSTTKQERSELAFMEYEISPKSGYVNSAIYVDRKFYYQVGVQLSSFMTVFPDLDDAIEVSILEATSSVVQRDGRTYNLLSDRYAIFPEKSGEVVIPSQRILLSAYPSNSRRRQLLNFHTEEQYIEVLSIPAEYPADVPWFPSKDVSVTREFDQTDLTNIKLGDALKWNVKIIAVGAYSESFPEFQLNVPEQFKIFTDLPDRQNVLCEKQLCGILTLTTTLIP
ncbi:MAG: BatD family protein, partial [Gammaproteobacteria bacterium]|nr:BatD family protein [Gammaproteobacteria bacterium]